ncbi:DGQHR domain-containing protein [Mesorhizobium sp. Root695]|uniref:DGQHR domain-containing protein n=1 Tax=Mesorhizobium sp. Root695 TaxID=1736589 RepID=UPI0009E73834|nr:DGQHR domain-containing protein [Mesorhizobium sp. Root695]
MEHAIKSGKLKIEAISDEVLGVKVIRGFARLCDLSALSKADIYDAHKNPTGTQRDLSPKHARDAYLYVRQEELAFWPEIFLSARDSAVWSFAGTPNSVIGSLSVDVDLISSSSKILISRVDGNHRLHYADGTSEGYPPITKIVSFCLAVNLTLEQEIKLFRDINNNQRRMNTSHLENIKVRLSDRSELATRDPKLYIADRLAKDSDSPLKGMVFYGGAKDVAKIVPLRTLKSGIEYMFSRPTRLTAIDDIDIQIKVIKNYLSALKKWEPSVWTSPRQYVMLRGAGFWGVCFLGAEVIDRALAKGGYKPDDMLAVLRSGKSWNWSNGGDFSGLSGRGGAVRIRDLIVAEFAEEESISLKSLMKKISDEI